MDIRAVSPQGYTYAEIGRMVGRQWPTVKRYLETGAQPVYRRKRMPSKLDEIKRMIDQWLAKEPRSGTGRRCCLPPSAYLRSSMIITSNKRVSGWAELFGYEVQAVATLDPAPTRRR